jgi:hypothetical protein
VPAPVRPDGEERELDTLRHVVSRCNQYNREVSAGRPEAFLSCRSALWLSWVPLACIRTSCRCSWGRRWWAMLTASWRRSSRCSRGPRRWVGHEATLLVAPPCA